ncbi:putative orfan [Tupanvirus soda lake]|uniref:Orfan n=2 Tax=Tupanvirus TaxID=2094720 RepID=A0AC62AD63_9VIRU|nr:putative orfan [Tupanvirus soda lake]QKU35721.1 putative orfan [Tupanvirus soda lake]
MLTKSQAIEHLTDITREFSKKPITESSFRNYFFWTRKVKRMCTEKITEEEFQTCMEPLRNMPLDNYMQFFKFYRN